MAVIVRRHIVLSAQEIVAADVCKAVAVGQPAGVREAGLRGVDLAVIVFFDLLRDCFVLGPTGAVLRLVQHADLLEHLLVHDQVSIHAEILVGGDAVEPTIHIERPHVILHQLIGLGRIFWNKLRQINELVVCVHPLQGGGRHDVDDIQLLTAGHIQREGIQPVADAQPLDVQLHADGGNQNLIDCIFHVLRNVDFVAEVVVIHHELLDIVGIDCFWLVGLFRLLCLGRLLVRLGIFLGGSGRLLLGGLLLLGRFLLCAGGKQAANQNGSQNQRQNALHLFHVSASFLL